jgi:hypothetical protein
LIAAITNADDTQPYSVVAPPRCGFGGTGDGSKAGYSGALLHESATVNGSVHGFILKIVKTRALQSQRWARCAGKLWRDFHDTAHLDMSPTIRKQRRESIKSGKTQD